MSEWKASDIIIKNVHDNLFLPVDAMSVAELRFYLLFVHNLISPAINNMLP